MPTPTPVNISVHSLEILLISSLVHPRIGVCPERHENCRSDDDDLFEVFAFE